MRTNLRLSLTVIMLSLSFGGTLVAGSLSEAVLLPAWESKDAYRPSVARGDKGYLLTWQAGMVREGDIVACILDEKGKPVQEKPFPVCTAKDNQERPEVAFGNGVYLVVWQDIRNGRDYDVYAARVTPEGRVLDRNGFVVAGGGHNQALPRVCYDGKDFVVAWQDFRSGRRYEIYAAHIDTSGKVKEKGGFRVASNKWFHRSNPAVTAAGEGKALVIWGANWSPGARAAKFGATLLKGGSSVEEVLTLEHKPGFFYRLPYAGIPMSIARCPDGTYMVVWRSWRPLGRSPGPSRKATALLLDKDFKLKKTFFPTGGTRYMMDPDVAWDGKAFVTVWYEQNVSRPPRGQYPFDRVCLLRSDTEGKPLGKVLRVAGKMEAPAKAARCAANGKGETLVVYEQHPSNASTPIKVGIRLFRAGKEENAGR